MTSLRRHGALAAGSLVVAGLLYRFDPVTTTWFPFCPFHVLTGLHCPGCGTLRALHALLHGHLLAALHYNAVTVVAMPFLIYAVAAGGSNQPVPAVLRSPALAWGALTVLLVFTVLRNLPWAPFCWLAPPPS